MKDNMKKDNALSEEYTDEIYYNAKNIVIKTGQTNAAILGRELKVSYARAKRIVDRLKEEGIISIESIY